MQTKQELAALSSWQARLQRATELLKTFTPFSSEQLAKAATSFYQKLVISEAYKPSNKFNGAVLFVRAKDNFFDFSEDYGLSEVRDKKSSSMEHN